MADEPVVPKGPYEYGPNDKPKGQAKIVEVEEVADPLADDTKSEQPN